MAKTLLQIFEIRATGASVKRKEPDPTMLDFLEV